MPWLGSGTLFNTFSAERQTKILSSSNQLSWIIYIYKTHTFTQLHKGVLQWGCILGFLGSFASANCSVWWLLVEEGMLSPISNGRDQKKNMNWVATCTKEGGSWMILTLSMTLQPALTFVRNLIAWNMVVLINNTSNTDGNPTNATYQGTNSLLNLIFFNFPCKSSVVVCDTTSTFLKTQFIRG